MDMYSGKDIIDMASSDRMRTFLKGNNINQLIYLDINFFKC